MKVPRPNHRQRRLPRLALTSLACFGLLLAASGCRKSSQAKNLILITLDTQRADAIGAYGSKRARTPAIDALAGEGLLFENAYSLIPITLPSHASIFLSAPPHDIRCYNNGQAVRKLRSRPSFVNLLRKNGFATAAFISLGVLGSEFNLNEGFQDYIDDFPENRWYLSAGEVNAKVFPWLEAHGQRKFFLWIHYSDPHDPYSPPDKVNDTKIYLNNKLLGEYPILSKYTTLTLDVKLNKGKNQLLFEVSNPAQRNPQQFMARLDKLDLIPVGNETAITKDFSWGWFLRSEDGVFFLKNGATLNITGDKEPQAVKIVLRGKLLLPLDAVREGYRKEVEYMDGEIGKLWTTLRRLGLYDNTAILLAGDHGEGLGEYRNPFGDPQIGHIHYLHNIYTKVPLIVRAPRMAEKGRRRTENVTLLDIAPTAAALMDLKYPRIYQGRDLLKLKAKEKNPVFQATYKPEAYSDKFAILDLPWHLIYNSGTNRYELFDLEKDPEEQQDLCANGRFPDEANPLKAKLETFTRAVLKDKQEIPLDSKTKEMLKALGYIGNK